MKVKEITRIVSDNCHGNMQMTAELKLSDDPIKVAVKLEKDIRAALGQTEYAKTLDYSIKSLEQQKATLEKEIKHLKESKLKIEGWFKKHKLTKKILEDDLPF